MHLEYAGVSLELLELQLVERENVYDPSKTDLLYIKWLVSAVCLYSPGGRWPVATAVTEITPDTTAELLGFTTRAAGAVRGAVPSRRASVPQEENVVGSPIGRTAIVTDVELRTRLALPRQELVIWAFDTNGQKIYWVRAPKAGFPCDPINGPKPLGPPDVVDVTGEGLTFGVHFQIEFATLPNPDASDQLVLSHRWQMTHESDDDHYLTRVINGEVVFNAALLEGFQIEPDWLRSQFFHPIPLGFQRLGPTVSLSPDGNVLKYEIADRDTSVTFDPGDSGASRMQIVERLNYQQPIRFL